MDISEGTMQLLTLFIGALSGVLGAVFSHMHLESQKNIDRESNEIQKTLSEVSENESVSGEVREFAILNETSLKLIDRLSERVKALENTRDELEKEREELKVTWSNERIALRAAFDIEIKIIKQMLDDCLADKLNRRK